MKILAIRIKNLASLEGICEIDFTIEPLCSAAIFAITGPTGAGKSTILDALCLALYAKTPRYLTAKDRDIEIQDVKGDTISQNDPRNILRDGTAEGFAEVDFEGVDGQKYQASWRIKRARNKAEGSLQTASIILKNISTNVDMPGRKQELLSEIERLVGLNFEQFTRSVLLAQGDFTAFLKAGKDEKSSLLEKLTGTHIYSEISRRIFERCRDENLALRELNIQRQGIPTLTAEELDALVHQKTLLVSNIETHEKMVQEITKEISWNEQLSNLQLNLKEATDNLEQATATKLDAGIRQQKFRQTEQVQPVRVWVDRRQTSQDQRSQKTTGVEKLGEDLCTLDIQRKSLVLNINEADSGLMNAIKSLDEAQPLIEEARALDVQITEKAEQLTNAETEVNIARKTSKLHGETVVQKQLELDSFQQDIDQLTKWKNDSIQRKPIAENQGVIISKLSDARKDLKTITSVSLLIVTTKDLLAGDTLKKENAVRKMKQVEESLKKTRDQYEIKLSAISAISISILEQDKSSIDTIVEDLIAAEAHWKLLYNSLLEHGNASKALTENKTELERVIKKLANTDEKLASAKIELENSLRMVEKVRMAATKNVETLRTLLVADEPCFVCGSKQHPYAIEHPMLNEVLSELETTHLARESIYTALLKEQSRLMENYKSLEKTISQQKTDLQTKTNTTDHLTEDWTTFAIYQDSTDLPDAEKAGWLRQRLNENKTLQKSLKDSIQSYHNERKGMEDQKTAADQLEKEVSRITNEIKDIERKLLSIQEKIEQCNTDLQNANNGLEEVEQILSPYFSSSQEFFQNWKKDPDAFEQTIKTFTDQWKASSLKLEESIRQHAIGTESIKGLRIQLEGYLADVIKKGETFSGIKKQSDELSGKRKTIFEGHVVANIESGLKLAIDNKRHALETYKSDLEKLQSMITRTTTQKEEAEKEIELLQTHVVTCDKKIQEWLNTYNIQNIPQLEEIELLELLAITSETMEEERKALRTIDDAITQSQSILSERKTALEKHEQLALSKRPLEELIILLEQAKTTLENCVTEKNGIDFRQGQDESNRVSIGNLLRTIEAKAHIVENWAKLNEIIGSADGKKFRQIAQEYTLDVMLGYSNIHLDMLSKRYTLQRIPDSLGLQITDRDMGNEIRTIYSLSGGESFLVSLALALGLASLSSSRTVESLFIDEGFGSLDPITLNIAMDALERLHNQGRKVGVISHVQEMTERIPIQIKVSKQAGGKSMVEILN